MRILFAIPHYFKPVEGGIYGSQSKNPQPRLQAVTNCVAALHQLFNKSQRIIDIGQRLALPANQSQSYDIDVVLCTTQNSHLLEQLPLPLHLYKHYPTNCEPMLLEFECQALLRDCLGGYDYFCFLEDDLILHDPWFFIKLGWFTKQAGSRNLLQPNRYEVSFNGVVNKVYIDGDLLPRVAGRFQDIQEQPQLTGKIMDTLVTFHRPLNPHSASYFLNAEQMAYWAQQPYFLDRDTSFVGPLESAATLGIMKTFRIYKAAPPNAGFLEIQHFGSKFLNLLGGEVRMA